MTDSTHNEHQKILEGLHDSIDQEMDSLKMGLLGTEVGIESMNGMFEYFTSMLFAALQNLAQERNVSIDQVRTELELELGLEGKFELLISSLSASRELIQDSMLQLHKD